MKESGIYRIAKLTNQYVITHDDKLLLRAQKSDIGLTDNWRTNVEIQYVNGEAIIVNYLLPNGEGGIEQVITPIEYEQLPEIIKAEYRAQPLRGIQVSERITATFRDNRMDLIIGDLFNDAESRYRKGLDNIVILTEKGVIKYTPRKAGADRNMREAIRHRARKYVKPTEYEHDILIIGEIGRALRDDLKAHDIGGIGEETIYLKGFKRYKGIKKSVKYYDVGHREGVRDGEHFKLETTFHKQYFKDNGIGVNELLTQPEIQDMLLIELTDTLKGVLNKCTEETLKMLEDILDIEPPKVKRDRTRHIAANMLGRDRTYTERLEEVERRINEHEQRIKRLEKRS